MKYRKTDMGLKFFYPYEASLAKEERVSFPSFQTQDSSWLDVFYLQKSCELTVPSQLP